MKEKQTKLKKVHETAGKPSIVMKWEILTYYNMQANTKNGDFHVIFDHFSRHFFLKMVPVDFFKLCLLKKIIKYLFMARF